MFLHSAWIFHPEAHVAPINSTKPPVISICSAQLASTQELTGVCRRAAASALSAKTAIFHRAVSGVTGSLSEAPHTPPSPPAFSLPWVEPTTRLRESRHDVWATLPHPRDISCGWNCDISYDCTHVVSRDPSRKICGNGVNGSNTAMLRICKLWCTMWWNVTS